MSKPILSVILPVWNAEKYLNVAINSILNQTFQDWELILINDGSIDSSGDICEEYKKKDSRITVLHNKDNLKLAKSLNIGIAQAKGKYIVRMDADDWSYPERLAKQYTYMESHPEVGLSGGSIEICDQNLIVKSRRKYFEYDKDIRKKLFRYSPFAHPVIIVRSDVLEKSGYYYNTYNPAEDYELYFRVGRYSKFGNLNDTLLKYRIVGDGMTGVGTKRMELMTLKIRREFAGQKGYKMSLFDKLYNIVEYVSVYLVSPKLKIKLFNLFRNSR